MISVLPWQHAYVYARLCGLLPLQFSLTSLPHFLGYADTVYSLLTDQKPPELSFQSPTAKCSSAAKGPRSTSLRNSIARTLESRGADNVSAIINLIRYASNHILSHVFLACTKACAFHFFAGLFFLQSEKVVFS